MIAMPISIHNVGEEQPQPMQARRGDPSVAIIKSAMAGLKQGDAFEFRDRDDNRIRVERLKLAHYGYHFRVYHNQVVHVVPFDTLATRRSAALWVMEYVHQHALWPTLKVMPGKALSFWHEYRDERSSSKQYVIRSSE